MAAEWQLAQASPQMFKLIKRLTGLGAEEPAPPVRRPTKRRPAARDYAASGPAPLPDVVEGNEKEDWSLWQDSVDSQMQGLGPPSQAYQDTQPSELQDLDPFANVGKNRDA
jgi:hypothetical protein